MKSIVDFTNAIKDYFATKQALSTMENYVTPQKYGAYGDGVHDDTTAIQNAINYGRDHRVSVFGFGIYLISEPIEINGNGINVDFMRSPIIYNGSAHAIGIYKLRDSTLRFGKIDCLGGTGYCIKFYSKVPLSTDSNDYIQYVNIYGNNWLSTTRCMSFERTEGYGWANEIHINNVHLTSGDQTKGVGLYINAINSDGWILNTCGIEGIKYGVETHTPTVSNNDGIGVSMINCRSNETYNKLIVTNGKAKINIQTVTPFLNRSIFTFSNETNGVIYGRYLDTDNTTYRGDFASIENGVIIAPTYLQPKETRISEFTCVGFTSPSWISHNSLFYTSNDGVKILQARIVVNNDATAISITGIPHMSVSGSRILVVAANPGLGEIHYGIISDQGVLSISGLTSGTEYYLSSVFV